MVIMVENRYADYKYRKTCSKRPRRLILCKVCQSL